MAHTSSYYCYIINKFLLCTICRYALRGGTPEVSSEMSYRPLLKLFFENLPFKLSLRDVSSCFGVSRKELHQDTSKVHHETNRVERECILIMCRVSFYYYYVIT